jgi:hypothetical protein
MANEPENIHAADDLNRVWDQSVLGLNEDPSAPKAPEVARLMGCDDAPLPDNEFVAKLRESLMREAGNRRSTAVRSPANLGIVKPFHAPWPIVSGRRIAIAAAIAACLTLIATAGSGFLHDQANAPTVASVLASPAGTPTVGPTTTAWIVSTRAVSVGREVTLLPQIEATVTSNANDFVAASTGLTVLQSAKDGTGQPWLFVQTSDGRTGWLPREETVPLEQ